MGSVSDLLYCGPGCAAGKSRAERFHIRSVLLFSWLAVVFAAGSQTTKLLKLVLYLYNYRVGEISGDYIVGGIRTPMPHSHNKVVQMPPKRRTSVISRVNWEQRIWVCKMRARGPHSALLRPFINCLLFIYLQGLQMNRYERTSGRKSYCEKPLLLVPLNLPDE